MVTSLAEAVLEKLRALPPEKQKEVLDFTEFLEQRVRRPKQGKSLYGLWADLDFEITDEQIDQARQEMWGNFPRDGI